MTELNEDRKTQVVRETQVALQMERLKEVSSDLEKSITGIRHGLTSVLKSGPSDDEEKPEKDREALVPLANDIRAIANRIGVLNVNVAMLLRDLEL